jgi:hypothetical protein
LSDLREAVRRGSQVKVMNKTKEETYITEHAMTDRQVEMVLAGSLINPCASVRTMINKAFLRFSKWPYELAKPRIAPVFSATW